MLIGIQSIKVDGILKTRPTARRFSFAISRESDERDVKLVLPVEIQMNSLGIAWRDGPLLASQSLSDRSLVRTTATSFSVAGWPSIQ